MSYFKILISVPFAALAFTALLYFVPIRDKDYALYDTLIKSSRPDENSSIISYSQQNRENVRKHIWYQEDSPLYFRIDSEESHLLFFHQNREVEVIEQMRNAFCIMQEELYYQLPDGKEVTDVESSQCGAKPMQRIRYLEADKACYNYNTHLFIAEDVKLWKFQLEGHEPPDHFINENCLMQATAHSVEFTLQGRKLDFTAYKMRASFNSDERGSL